MRYRLVKHRALSQRFVSAYRSDLASLHEGGARTTLEAPA